MTEDFPLFEKIPELKEIKRISLGIFPTPIQKLSNIEAFLENKANIYIKRDDLTSNIYGGNKVRKLEFTLAKILAEKSTRIITGGGIGSNMTLAISAFAKKYNIKVNSVLFEQPLNEHVKNNLLLNSFFNNNICYCKNYLGLSIRLLEKLVFYTFKDKKLPYLIVPGDSNPLSNLGYVNAVFELKNQIEENILPEPDFIFVSAGSCGTIAGLLAGIKLAKLNSKIMGVRVAEPIVANKKNIMKMANKTLTYISKYTKRNLSEYVTNSDFEILTDYLGEGYGYPIPKLQETISFLEQKEGIKLDPTYTAKTMLALIDFVNKSDRKYNVLFINTLNSVDFNDEIKKINVADLPKNFHRFFDKKI